jgi:hypothetical protein
VDDDYTAKSAQAGRMGKAAEHLVAAFCILSRVARCLDVAGRRRGGDLVFHRRNSTTTLAVQVKARMSDSKRVQSQGFVAFVRSQTFQPRHGLDMLFVAIDVARGAVMHAWLIPSLDYAKTLGKPSSRGRYRFSASMKDATNDRWRPYRLTAEQLPPAILNRLDALSTHLMGEVR